MPQRKKPATRKRPDPTNEEILRLEALTASLKQENRDLERKLKLSFKEGHIFAEAAELIRETVSPLRPINVRKIEDKDNEAHNCDLVLLLSDEHADQIVTASGTWGLEQYDFNIFRVRLERLLSQTIKYATEHLPRHKFERLWVLKLGDTVNGDIHGAGPKNHFKNTIKAALAVGDVEAQFVQALTPYFPGGVHVVGVSGNHPRKSMRKDYGGPHDNYDYLVTAQMAARLADEIDAGRVSVHAPESWTAFVEIRGRVWALNHGDDVKGFAGFPWYGFDRKNNRVQALLARFDRKVDYFCYGHYHTNASFVSGGAQSIHSGAWPMTDPFAINAVNAGNEPVQTLYAVDDKFGIVLPIPIYVRDIDTEKQFRQGKFDPELGRNLLINKITPDKSPGSLSLYKP